MSKANLIHANLENVNLETINLYGTITYNTNFNNALLICMGSSVYHICLKENITNFLVKYC